jgi:hypothetical protein
MEQAFVNLMDRFTTALILTQYSPEHQCIVETITSDFALGAVISQKGSNDKLYPIAYHSRKFSSAEINNEIHDKELLAVVDSFKTWRKYLDGALLPVRVYTDHQNLEYFTTRKVLNRWQARWAQELPAWISKSATVPGHKTASRMHSHGGRSTALRKGEVKSNRFKHCSKKNILKTKNY